LKVGITIPVLSDGEMINSIRMGIGLNMAII
jgi:hypothetical protein